MAQALRAPVDRISRSGQWLVWLLNVSLFVFCAYDFYRIYRSVTGGDEAALPVAKQQTGTAKAKPGSAPELVWNDWHPFGRPPEGQKKGQTAAGKERIPEDAPETRLHLTLTGLLAEKGGEGQSWVLVRSGSEAEKLVSSADKLPGDARIVSVQSDRVILEKGGRFETLRLPKNVVPLEEKPGNPAAASNPTPDDPAMVLKQLREQFQTRPDEVFKKFPVTPMMGKEGGFTGFALQAGSDPGLLDKLGLQPGDVVTVVNGQPLTSLNAGREALAALGQSQSVQLSLMRDGQPMSVNLAFGSN
ncbi:MAG: hypothetical protein HQL91_01435 [Magnetococcales bacterium]|nr:hypothetical protein [Magnetococcales bacterium]